MELQEELMRDKTVEKGDLAEEDVKMVEERIEENNCKSGMPTKNE